MPAEAWVALVFGLLGIMGTIVVSVAKLSGQLAKSTTRFELIGAQQAVEISKMNQAIEKIEITMATLAADRERMSNLDRRVSKLEEWYDELRRGIGKIVT